MQFVVFDDNFCFGCLDHLRYFNFSFTLIIIILTLNCMYFHYLNIRPIDPNQLITGLKSSILCCRSVVKHLMNTINQF